VHLDLVARAHELLARCSCERAVLRALDAQREHAAPRWRGASRASQPRAPAARDLACVESAIEQLAPQRI